MSNFTINLENDKYTIHYNNGEISCDRYGEPWRKEDLVGDNLIHALVVELHDMYKEFDIAVDIINEQGGCYEELRDLYEQDQ